ncbi:hypothetical protein V8E51_010580 [Hyaloscypha variabilis]
MYAPAYGYGPANPSASAPGAPFNPNPNPNPNGAPPLHLQSQAQLQQSPHHHPQQPQPGHQPQHLMYNPQQYGGGVSPAPHQSPYGGAGQPGPGMGANAGAMGMMQNNGMAHMPGGVPTYQTPYSSSPYGGNMPASSGANISFMPTTSNAPSFPMNAPNMNPQHQGQRMQPPSSSTPTQPGPRAAPFGNVPQNTPPNAAAQAQFSTPQNQNQTHLQTPNNNQGAQAGTVITPQTPNFPPGSQGANAGSNIATPLSPGSEAREKERVTLLLEINRELLQECMRLNSIAEAKAQAETEKNEAASATASPNGPQKDKEEKEKEKAEKPPPKQTRDYLTREYYECMRRLQCNLAYLAAIADRSHKPSSQIPAHPAIMFAPPPSQKPSGQHTPSSISSPTTKKEDSSEDKKPDQDVKRPEEMEAERALAVGDLYKKLQALFPGVDPKKEPPVARNQQQMQAQAQKQNAAAVQGNAGMNVGGGDANAQQRARDDLLRQKMMQQQQQQQAQQQGQVQNR